MQVIVIIVISEFLERHLKALNLFMSTDNNNNNNNNDNLYGAVTRPYRYKGASQATKQGKP